MEAWCVAVFEVALEPGNLLPPEVVATLVHHPPESHSHYLACIVNNNC